MTVGIDRRRPSTGAVEATYTLHHRPVNLAARAQPPQLKVLAQLLTGPTAALVGIAAQGREIPAGARREQRAPTPGQIA